jgi:Rieske Fe-S protein
MASIMEKQKQITRKFFFQIVASSVVALIVWIWFRLSDFQTERENIMEFRHGQDIPMGISYFEKYYIFRNNISVRAFLTRCTHAGCRIGQSTGTTLQCNCHGSRFDAETGSPLKGPAIKPLEEVECRFDEKAAQWIVRLQTKKNKTV